MEEFEVSIGGRTYTLTATPDSVELVQEHARRLDRHAGELLAEMDGALPESLLILLASIHAMDELEGTAIDREELLLSGTEAMREVTLQVRALSEQLDRRSGKRSAAKR